MKLSSVEAMTRLRGESHGVLATIHPERGPAPQPVVYAVDKVGHLGVPIDRVKAKSSPRLQREANLAADPRGALLVEHWEAVDWSRLWWVRADLEHVPDPPVAVVEALADRLATTIPQYADRPFHRILVCRILRVRGWAATEGDRA
ncbi:MAG: pyridoxamine 5'-phosphate oxidase family protein [Nocardioides sp.]|nr:pyridoxamine 5'-phosphate oxidase family protein [Nocardioides sp.]